MTRKTAPLQVEEIPGEKYPDLQTAQAQARHALAGDLAATLRSLLAAGWLVNVNGKLIPNPERIA
jgi:hypothetical protein